MGFPRCPLLRHCFTCSFSISMFLSVSVCMCFSACGLPPLMGWAAQCFCHTARYENSLCFSMLRWNSLKKEICQRDRFNSVGHSGKWMRWMRMLVHIWFSVCLSNWPFHNRFRWYFMADSVFILCSSSMSVGFKEFDRGLFMAIWLLKIAHSAPFSYFVADLSSVWCESLYIRIFLFFRVCEDHFLAIFKSGSIDHAKKLKPRYPTDVWMVCVCSTIYS